MRLARGPVLVPLIAALAACAGCTPNAETHQTSVEIRRMQVVQRDAKGAPIALDIELEYPDCPGEQEEILQGDSVFAQCMAKYKPGERVPATIHWESVGYGHFDSEVVRVGDCDRKRDLADERSYEVLQVCSDIVANGVKVGFRCDRKPSPELLQKCPWFRRS